MFLLYWFGMDQLVGCFINAVIISIIKQPGDHPHITYLQPFLPAVHARWNINRITWGDLNTFIDFWAMFMIFSQINPRMGADLNFCNLY